MGVKLWWIPPNCKGKGSKAHLYLRNWDVVNSPWSCHVLWWFLRGIHPLLSQTVHSGKHTWPVLGKWMLEAFWSPEGQRLYISSRGSWGVVYWPALGEWKLQRKRGFCTASWKDLSLLLVKSTDVGLWPGHPLGSGLKAVHCILLLSWMCFVFHKLAPAP